MKKPMQFKKVLIAIDGSPIGDHAFDIGLSLASRLDAEVGLIHVVDTHLLAGAEGFSPVGLLDELQGQGRQLLDSVVTRCGNKVRAFPFLKVGLPAVEIVTMAESWGADITVMGTHGRSGMKRVLLGSCAEEVLRHTACPVLTVKGIDSLEGSFRR